MGKATTVRCLSGLRFPAQGFLQSSNELDDSVCQAKSMSAFVLRDESTSSTDLQMRSQFRCRSASYVHELNVLCKVRAGVTFGDIRRNG